MNFIADDFFVHYAKIKPLIEIYFSIFFQIEKQKYFHQSFSSIDARYIIDMTHREHLFAINQSNSYSIRRKTSTNND